MGSNPTGHSIPEDRKIEMCAGSIRREIRFREADFLVYFNSLKLAKQYNLLIFEDDAYVSRCLDRTIKGNLCTNFLASIQAFLYYGPAEKKARSYFELESEVNQEVGRVVRFDSFSKILSSGMRLGFITASKQICDAMDLITANSK